MTSNLSVIINYSVNVCQQADPSSHTHYLILVSIVSFLTYLFAKISSIVYLNPAEFQYFSINNSKRSLLIPVLTN